MLLLYGKDQNKHSGKSHKLITIWIGNIVKECYVSVWVRLCVGVCFNRGENDTHLHQSDDKTDKSLNAGHAPVLCLQLWITSVYE